MKKEQAHVLTLILSVLLVLVGFSVLVVSETASDVISESYLLSPLDLGLWFFVVLVVLVAPLFEEFFFRLWLKPKYLWGIVLMVTFSVVSLEIKAIGIGLALITVVVLFYYRKSQEQLKKYPLIGVVISGFLFSLLHSANFTELYFAHFWLFLIFLGLGMIFGLTRLRFGLWAAIFCHAFYNLLVTWPTLPDWNESSLEFENSVLIEHGIFDNATLINNMENSLCNHCPIDKLIFTLAYKAYPDALIVVESGNEVSFTQYSLESVAPNEYELILEDIERHFNTKTEMNFQLVEEVQLSFICNSEYEPTTENFVKHRAKSLDGITFSAVRMLIPHLEMEYGVKLNCLQNCDAMLVLPIEHSLSLEENLQQLSGKGLIEYSIEKRKVKVVTISHE